MIQKGFSTMYHLKEETTHTIIIEKSRFITYLNRVFSEEEAKAYITSIQKMHPDATHHCYAFLIGEHDEIQRSNDNGEPSGTAGVPMLECLKKNHVQHIVAVTVRYFGGIKLGAGGLIRAYSRSVSEALKASVLTKKVNMKRYSLRFSYDLIGKIDYYFGTHSIQVTKKEYEEDVYYEYRCIHPCNDDISEISGGKYLPIYIEDETVEEEILLED